MTDRRTTREMVATKSKNKVLTCSTPDHTLDSPSRDSDSMCDSETASPVPFLCTQDGTEGLTDVVWNYYNTNSKSTLPKNSTPISKKVRKPHRLKLPEKEVKSTLPKRRITRLSQKKAQLPTELLELNQFVDKLMKRKSKAISAVQKPQSGSEEDIFSDATDSSPKSIFRTKKCLRKNVLSSKFPKSESENGLESDDSINECLLKASQAVEEIFNEVPAKRPCYETHRSPAVNKLNEDSMDTIFRTIRSPYINKMKCESPGLKNDSFDNLVGNLNDSALERLTQMPVRNGSSTRKTERNKATDTSWKLEDLVIQESPSRFSFARHSSMPESPSMTNHNKPSSTGVALGKYNSMPFNDSSEKITDDSPIRCTPLEIQKKHQQAREKLLAKRLLPFTQTQQASHSLPTQLSNHPNHSNSQVAEPQVKVKFQPKVPFNAISRPTKADPIIKPEKSTNKQDMVPSKMDLRSLIEKKRQEALLKLRRKHLQK